MPAKRERRLRAVARLIESAHRALHLLLALRDDITDTTIAAECGARAAELTEAINRAVRIGKRDEK